MPTRQHHVASVLLIAAAGGTALMGAVAWAASTPPAATHSAQRLRAATRAAGIVAAAPLTTSTAVLPPTRTPRPTGTMPATPTDWPAVAPTADGTLIPIGQPLPTPAPAVDAITVDNAYALRELYRYAPFPECIDCREVLGAFGPDGRVVYDVVPDILLVARSLSDGAELWRARTSADGRWGSVAASPDGKIVAFQGLRGAEFWAADTGTLLRTVEGFGGDTMSFADEGRQLAFALHDAWATVLDVASGTSLAQRRTAVWADLSVRLRPGHAEVSAVPYYSNALVGVDILTGVERWRLSPPAGAGWRTSTISAWSADGRTVAWRVDHEAGSMDASICRSDLVGPPVCFPLAVYGGIPHPWGLSVANSGRVVVAGERHSHPFVCERLGVDVMDVDGTVRTVFEAPQRALGSLAISPDGELVAISSWPCDGSPSSIGDTVVAALATGRILAHLPRAAEPTFSPDGGRLVVTEPVAVGRDWRWDMRGYGIDVRGAVVRRAFLPVAWAGW